MILSSFLCCLELAVQMQLQFRYNSIWLKVLCCCRRSTYSIFLSCGTGPLKWIYVSWMTFTRDYWLSWKWRKAASCISVISQIADLFVSKTLPLSLGYHLWSGCIPLPGDELQNINEMDCVPSVALKEMPFVELDVEQISSPQTAPPPPSTRHSPHFKESIASRMELNSSTFKFGCVMFGSLSSESI